MSFKKISHSVTEVFNNKLEGIKNVILITYYIILKLRKE